MLVHELVNEDTDVVPKEAPLIVLDSKYVMCMAKNIPNIPDILQEYCIL